MTCAVCGTTPGTMKYNDQLYCMKCWTNTIVQVCIDQISTATGVPSTRDMSPAALDEANGGLPVVEEPEPLVAYKAADLVVTTSADGTRTAAFRAVNAGHTYAPVDVAACNFDLRHPVPTLDCSCGFYAWKKVEDIDEYRNPAKLQVELYGRVLDGALGYRAEKQRVMRMDFPRQCRSCPRPSKHLCLVSDHQAGAVAASYVVAPMCDNHRGKLEEITPAELTGLLGTEVMWSPSDTDTYRWETAIRFGPSLVVMVAAVVVLLLHVVSFGVYDIICIANGAGFVLWNYLTSRRRQQYFDAMGGVLRE